ncbi:Eaa1 [Klebsiella oxytoca]|nr:Eaa1 [Klebsiella oxytoca]HBQ8021658.1 DUF551 domain-containing protein [Klebsiella aerogenes]SAQ43335.1 Eaa1 [Klebsiella oxytoca]SAQ52748.1 Eaa1 [Klebsiella oxytoca]HCK2578818.1 DUF551 domain-containing protein [Klebsiella oxytoca]
MTKSTITRELLEEWVAQFEEDGGCDATDRQLEALIRQSLEAMDSEPAAPVAEVVSIYGDHEAFGEREIRPLVGIQQMPYGTKLYRHAQQPVVESEPVAEVLSNRPGNDTSTIDRALPVGTQLYRHAQPAPVVPEEATPDSIEILASARRRDHAVFQWDEDQRNAAADSWNACRAAMLQAKSLTSINPAPTLVSLPKNAKSLTGNSPVIGIDLASGPDRTVEVHYVVPPGYVVVPKEPTEEMLQASYREAAVYSPTTYRAMIAAAPQSPGSEHATVPGRWIPVSERMPEPGILVLVYTPPQPDDYPGDVRIGFDYIDPDGDDPTYWFNHAENYEHFYCVACDGMTGPSEKAPYTHWIPLPAAPQEVKGE